MPGPVNDWRYADWNPVDHPRDPDGKFTNGLPDLDLPDWIAGNWTRIDTDELQAPSVQEYLSYYEGKPLPYGWDKPGVLMGKAKEAARAEVPDGTWEIRNGPYKITNRGGARNKSAMEVAAQALDALVEANPLPEGLSVSFSDDVRPGSEGALAATDLSGTMILGYKAWQDKVQAGPGWFMPEQQEADDLAYQAYAEEFGWQPPQLF